jgi:hypothetical protein
MGEKNRYIEFLGCGRSKELEKGNGVRGGTHILYWVVVSSPFSLTLYLMPMSRSRGFRAFGAQDSVPMIWSPELIVRVFGV